MAKYGSDQVAFYTVDGYDLKGDVTEFDISVESMFEETHGLGDGWREQTPTGIRLATLQQQGFFDDAAGAVNAALQEQQQTSRIVAYALAGNTRGNKATGIQGAFGGKVTRLGSRGALQKLNCDFRVSGQVDECLILDPLTAVTADGNTQGANAVDNGASSSGGLVAYLIGTAYAGFTQVVFKIRHSTDNSSYADLITFTTVVSGPFALRATVAGTVNRYLATADDVTGSGSVTRAFIAARG